MMKKQILSALLMALFFHSPTLVQAANSDYQEVTYDDLLNELSAKKKVIKNNSTSAFDTVMIHAGLGYVNSLTNIKANEKNFSRYQNGMQLSMGVDLFSPNWYSEGIFRNFGVTDKGSEELSLRELDLKIGYKNHLQGPWNYTLSTGLANRYLKMVDESAGININDTTPHWLMSAGILGYANKHLSVGIEANVRTSMVNRTADKSSYDLAFRISTSL